jgi:hypothetical protein
VTVEYSFLREHAPDLHQVRTTTNISIHFVADEGMDRAPLVSTSALVDMRT